MSARWWFRLDTAAHRLYTPTMLGRGCVAARWHHRLHLIPGAALTWVCDRHDRAMGAS